MELNGRTVVLKNKCKREASLAEKQVQLIGAQKGVRCMNHTIAKYIKELVPYKSTVVDREKQEEIKKLYPTSTKRKCKIILTGKQLEEKQFQEKQNKIFWLENKIYNCPSLSKEAIKNYKKQLKNLLMED